jgi:hypothetical protein
MKTYCIENLMDIRKLLESLSEEEYAKPLPILSDSSLGQHVRHILELYTSVTDALEAGILNYDKRKRDPKVETAPLHAIKLLDNLVETLKKVDSDMILNLEGNFSKDDDHSLIISTSLYRELAYNLEHSIHHQALIKIGCLSIGFGHLIYEDFGVAPATLRYRRENLIQIT